MDEYYTSQAGSGIGGYAGHRYQRGAGFFGRILTGGILPLIKKVLPYLGRKAMDTGLEIADDLMEGKDIKDTMKTRLASSAKMVAGDAIAKVRQMRGSGYKRRKRPSTTSLKRFGLVPTIVRKKRRRRKVKGIPKKRTVKRKRRTTTKRKRKVTAVDFL
jgi:hypothetical protein